MLNHKSLSIFFSKTFRWRTLGRYIIVPEKRSKASFLSLSARYDINKGKIGSHIYQQGHDGNNLSIAVLKQSTYKSFNRADMDSRNAHVNCVFDIKTDLYVTRKDPTVRFNFFWRFYNQDLSELGQTYLCETVARLLNILLKTFGFKERCRICLKTLNLDQESQTIQCGVDRGRDKVFWVCTSFTSIPSWSEQIETRNELACVFEIRRDYSISGKL